MIKFVKIGIYGIWGLFLCLAAIEKFGDFFAAGSGFWSVIMLTVAGLCQLGAALIAIGWAVLAFGTLRSKYLPYKFVNNYTVPVLIVGLAVVASIARSSSDEARALKLGFKDGKEFAIARENNITNVSDYAKFSEEQRAKVAAKAAHDALAAAEKAEQDKVAEYVAIFSDAGRKDRAQELISKDLKENPELTKRIIDEIASYSNDSVDRDVAEMDYLNYGVSSKEYMSAIESSNCRQTYKYRLSPLNEWQKTQLQLLKERSDATNWDLLDESQRKHERKELAYEQDHITTEYFKEQRVVQESFNECVFNLLSTIPVRLSRPKATPTPVIYGVSDGIKCMRKPEGTIDLCY
ncbi:hypothetical protein IG611_08745 [Pectobacterium sp. A535-S3-A17]|uniref:hypothetical protein n=1 Tax=Pectobacterium quasiaquaticum TaxID=2774015 RepID=UPI001873EAF6|nr:hypothetical protein [Pectobacterium quasiaquaticum]MBE5213687.1 hypothetical protein [Pectobacterium quasiaquaticum]MBE5225442.1 hypothetical protein [Pectobacterium quasiaquaticum]